MTTKELLTRFSDNHNAMTKLGNWIFWSAIFVATLAAAPQANAALDCAAGPITADVVVFDSPTVFNRLGAQNPNYIMYALKRDVVNKSTQVPCSMGGCTAGNVELRPDKRPRPLVVRSVAGCNLTVTLTNWLHTTANQNNPPANPNNCPAGPNQAACLAALDNNDQVAGRCASFHASGTELVSSMADDGSMVGANAGANTGDSTNDPSSATCGPGMVGPGDTVTYELHTPHEGAFVINSYGATLGSEGNAGNLGLGMFGALNVQPRNTKGIYRSQVTEEELRLATTGLIPATGQPIIDYEATYPDSPPWSLEGKGGKPILNMLDGNALFHSDINAIIVGSNPDGSFPNDTYPLESTNTANNPQLPNRLEPFREFTSIYHDEQTNAQVFPLWYSDPVLKHTIHGVRDSFMINYGSGGIGSEIISNRLHTGPMHDCTDCAYEEFFLASQTVGDPAGLVDYPANTGIELCDPRAIAGSSCWRDPLNLANGPITNVGGTPVRNYALYQEDPSNVHHSYTGDFAKIRNIHAGAFEQHIFHLHNHQWLFNPNDDNGNYLDAQEIMPGSGHTYELVNGGVGNRNKTAGDAIFHCHFYPHFAQGMWYHIRIQDVFERGTVLEVSNADDPQNPPLWNPLRTTHNFHETTFALRSGQPAAGSRALPDAELPDGWPIPAIVPLPGKPMPPMPSTVTVKAVDRGDFSLVTGRQPPAPDVGNTLNQGPDSAQAVVYRDCTEAGAPANCIPALGADGTLGGTGANADRTPGFPFWLAGNECGPGAGATDDVCDHGTVGQRMPTPVLDMLSEAAAQHASMPASWEHLGGGWDGGLPRHNLRGYTSGGLSHDTNNRLDFRKVVERAQPVYYPELGTDIEQVSMAHHAVRCHDTFTSDGAPANCVVNADLNEVGGFILNGSEAVPGGPFNDPCVDDRGVRVGSGDGEGHWFDGDGNPSTLLTKGTSYFDGEYPRVYKVANVQIDAVFNKVGHHYSQERIITLWGDVEASINKTKPPEPLVMRLNTFDCGKILHANLVPAEFELDDFQVRTPTDIIGQHIHLPKWDLTTNDGAANGWNYEDGTLSPIMVQERIHAIDVFNAEVAAEIATPGTHPDLAGLAPVATLPNPCNDDGTADCGTVGGLTDLTAVAHPFFGEGQTIQTSAGPEPEWKGARTTIQRMMADPVVNVAGVDRGLGLVFSHDHYGPSTFQQIGLYSTILIQPAGSTWRHNESGSWLNADDEGTWGREVTGPGGLTTFDGGPTSWQAVIEPPAAAPYGSTVQSETLKDHREFYFEMSDFQHAYNADFYVGADASGKPMLTNIVQPDPFNAAEATAPGIQDAWQNAVNPTLKLMHNGGFPAVVSAHGACPGGVRGGEVRNDPNVPRPCAEAINVGHSSIWVINYRNEPVGLRVFDPDLTGPDGQNGAQAGGDPEDIGADPVNARAGDLAFAFDSNTNRAIPELNTSFGNTPATYQMNSAHCVGSGGDGINCDRMPGDPFTPIMRAYQGDEVKVKIQTGATEEQHQATVHGVKWLSNGSGFGRSPNSGWRNFQSAGISEQFSLQVPVGVSTTNQVGGRSDYFYATDATRPGIWLGTWGILRSYGSARADLVELPDNPAAGQVQITNNNVFDGICPRFVLDENGDIVDPPGRDRNIPIVPVEYDVTVVLANEVLPNNLGVVIPANAGGDSDGDGVGDNAGGPLITAEGPDGILLDDPYTEEDESADNGGTLVYNRRQTTIPADPLHGLPTEVAGPLNDPTAILYVRTEDLIFDLACAAPGPNDAPDLDPFDRCRTNLGDPVRLKSIAEGDEYDAPVEPLVLRANAGQCMEVRLRNALPFVPVDLIDEDPESPTYEKVVGIDPQFIAMPDLAGWQDMMWGVTRRIQDNGAVGPSVEDQMYFFNNNLVRPSNYAGLHAQLVAYDHTRDQGVLVGQNSQGVTLVAPGGQKIYKWYAGDIRHERVMGGNPNQVRFTRIPTPVEFGASNLLSADRIKQPQKGLFGALSILPEGTTNVDESTLVPDGQGTGDATRLTRAQVTVTSPAGAAGSGGTFREMLQIGHKIANLRWADGSAIRNLGQANLGVEGAEDSGHAGFNYGMEPSWFRFRIAPDSPSGNALAPGYGSIPNVQAFYANALVSGEANAIPYIAGVSEAGDPQTPVFRAEPGQASRMHVLNGASADRDGTFILHGHLWQRDPYVCPGQSDLGLAGRCSPNEPVPSRALGNNLQGKWMGGEEGMGHVYGHWPILFNAGGSNAATLTGCSDNGACDFLFRDYAPNGNRNGQFGILRVQQ